MNQYTSFFNLDENPFVLTPDPKYLYLGRKHREVLSHLLYGIKEDKGFMVVVGEVGTGKTTLCRAFINQLLKDNIEVGLIYNPAMTDLELLQAINREFTISSDFESKGKLIDALNVFLLKINGEGRKVVLIIDEAQNLDLSVMEQLRLITNLETETRKLIQIILVGQPELERILAKKEMRQLDQRIVVRGLLGPFNIKETMSYIRHRLKVATMDNADKVVSFSDGACRRIYKLSGGIPRVINILGDRSLLVSYAKGKKDINKAIVKKAYKDLESSRYRPKARPFYLRWQTGVVFCVFVLVLWGWFYQDILKKKIWKAETTGFSQIKGSSSTGKILVIPTIKKKIKDSSESVTDQLFFSLKGLSKEASWQLAVKSVFKLWDEEIPVPSGVTIGSIPEGTGLNTWEVYGNITRLTSLNYPAIVLVKRPNDYSGIYVVLRAFSDNKAVVIGKKEVVIREKEFNNLWYGYGCIIWKDFEKLPRVIYPDSSSVFVTWLQHNLKHLKYFEDRITGFYDDKTKAAVVRLQKEKNLFVDGIVGPQTKMVLYSLLDIYKKPTLLNQNTQRD